VLLYPIEASDEMAFFRGPSKTEAFKALLEKEGFQVGLFEGNTAGFEGLQRPVGEMLEKYDLLLYLSNLATKSNQTIVRIEWAQPMGVNVPQLIQQIPTVFISIANPYHLLDVPRVKTFINCYDASDTVIAALVEKLMGRGGFCGISPVDAFCGKWDTHL
jgi:beta-N-acetylhexosaminidase